ncbi:MAG: YicC/YloC family endoribonuclease [Candidatus Omnitrophota bacterium]
MISSMTGFGRSVIDSPYGEVAAEIKSLNHKSLSVSCSTFSGFFMLEERVQSLFQGKIFRGKVFVHLSIEKKKAKKTIEGIAVNEAVAGSYLKEVKKLQKKLGLQGEIGIQEILSMPGVVENVSDKAAESKLWPYVKKALEQACANLMEFRLREGRALARDFEKRVQKIRKTVKEIRKHEKESVDRFRARLTQSIKDISVFEPDKTRLETEVASFAKNCDIAEEVTRLEGHLVVFKDAIDKDNRDVGKKLDFIAQEMQREANTIGSKADDFRISQAVIEVKSEIEKIREQIRNIE